MKNSLWKKCIQTIRNVKYYFKKYTVQLILDVSENSWGFGRNEKKMLHPYPVFSFRSLGKFLVSFRMSFRRITYLSHNEIVSLKSRGGYNAASSQLRMHCSPKRGGALLNLILANWKQIFTGKNERLNGEHDCNGTEHIK